jgi:hypothetical protein
MIKIPRLKREAGDLVPRIVSRTAQMLFGTALAGLGWLGLADAHATPVGGPTILPTASAFEERQKKWPKLVLKLKDMGSRVLVGRRSHSSHSSHRSHTSHSSHYSGSTAPAPPSSPTPSPKKASPSPSSSTTSYLSAGPTVENQLQITVVSVDRFGHVLTGRDETETLVVFEFENDVPDIPTPGQKVRVTWKSSGDGKNKIATKFQK